MEAFTDKLLEIVLLRMACETVRGAAWSTLPPLRQTCLHWWREMTRRLCRDTYTSSVSVNAIRTLINSEGGFLSPYFFLSSPYRISRGRYQNISPTVLDHYFRSFSIHLIRCRYFSSFSFVLGLPPLPYLFNNKTNDSKEHHCYRWVFTENPKPQTEAFTVIHQDQRTSGEWRSSIYIRYLHAHRLEMGSVTILYLMSTFSASAQGCSRCWIAEYRTAGEASLLVLPRDYKKLLRVTLAINLSRS